MRDLSDFLGSPGHAQSPPRGGERRALRSVGRRAPRSQSPESAEGAEAGDCGEAGETVLAGDFGEAGVFGEAVVRGDFGETGAVGETGVLAEYGVVGETAVRAETGVSVVVAEPAGVAVGEAAGVALGLAASLGAPLGVPSSWTESHSGPSPLPAAKGPTPSAALPPTPITPRDPTTSHVVRLGSFIFVLPRACAQMSSSYDTADR